MWIFSYGSAGPDIDASKFSEYRGARLDVDECYTTTDHALKYTLVHLKRRSRQTAIKGFVDYLTLAYGIVPSEIFGYSVVSANNVSNDLYEYPGFKILHQHMNEGNPSFSFWIESSSLRRGGILMRYNNLHPVQHEASGSDEREKVVCFDFLL